MLLLMACCIYLPALLTTKKFSYEHRLIEFWIFYCYSDSTHDSLPVGMFINKTMGFI